MTENSQKFWLLQRSDGCKTFFKLNINLIYKYYSQILFFKLNINLIYKYYSLAIRFPSFHKFHPSIIL